MTEATTDRAAGTASVPPRERKKILVVSAHPEPRSLNAHLTAFAVEHLRAAGHEVRVSDLYAMKWKAVVDADDFPDHAADRRLQVMDASQRATLAGRLTPDVVAEQEKLRWSDAVILQFPLWWFSVPAILKGWIERVFTAGFAYGAQVPPPYGDQAPLAGRRALVSVTAGARGTSLSDRGVHGRLADVLHPVQHGLFWFTGMAPLEPFAVYGANALPEEDAEAAKRAYARRLDGLFTDPPVPFRPLAEDYDHDMRLLPGTERPGTGGLDLHLRHAPGSG